MNIAVIGPGNVGTGLAKNFARAGYGVVLGSRDPQRGGEVAAELGQGVQGCSIAEAVGDADVVFLAVPFDAAAESLAAAGSLDGKILVDVTNPLTPDFMELTIGHTSSAGEEVQKLAPGVPVVKAFNSVFAEVLHEGPDFNGTKVQVFCAGDDETAKATVAEIIDAAGFDPVDAGPLKNARYLEPLAELVIQLGHVLGRGTQMAPAIIERNI